MCRRYFLASAPYGPSQTRACPIVRQNRHLVILRRRLAFKHEAANVPIGFQRAGPSRMGRNGDRTSSCSQLWKRSLMRQRIPPDVGPPIPSCSPGPPDFPGVRPPDFLGMGHGPEPLFVFGGARCCAPPRPQERKGDVNSGGALSGSKSQATPPLSTDRGASTVDDPSFPQSPPQLRASPLTQPNRLSLCLCSHAESRMARRELTVQRYEEIK